MPIVDSHVHWWDPARFDYPWLAGTALARRFGVGDLLDASAGVDVMSFIVVQGDCVPRQSLAEVDWIAAQMRRHGTDGGIVAFAPVELGRAVTPFLRLLRTMPHVVGVRRLLQDERRGFGLQRGFVTGLKLLAEVGLPFDVCVRAPQLPDVIEFVCRVPEVNFVLDHLGKPPVAGADDGWRDNLSALAQNPNVLCKLSGLSTETAGVQWNSQVVRPYLAHALDAFGPARCLFGTDWPVLTTEGTYHQWLDAVLDALGGFTDVEVTQVMSGTARSVYGLTDLVVE